MLAAGHRWQQSDPVTVLERVVPRNEFVIDGDAEIFG